MNPMKRRRALLLAFLAAGFACPVPGSADGETRGPERGTLVIMGGGGRALPAVFGRFVQLAGGKDAKIVIVTTAASSSPKYDYMNPGLLRLARTRYPASGVTVLHTHDRKRADTEEFVAPLREASGVWFSGGRQWRFADAYLGTLTEREFHNVLKRGGVIGGSSAGATIQGSFLARGDTSGNRIMIGDHQKGFGFLTNSAIDQHVIPRKRQLDLIEVLTDPDKKMLKGIDRGSLLGLGIDEDTAIVVRGDRFEVIGKKDGKVLVYDPRSWKPETPDRKKYVTLTRGARYDLKRRATLEPK